MSKGERDAAATVADIARRLNRASGRPLPPLLLMTDVQRLPDPAPLLADLPAGTAVILRHPEEAERTALAGRLAPRCRSLGVPLIVAGDLRLAIDVTADGLHLPESLARSDLVTEFRASGGRRVTAAAHSPEAIERAARAGVDAVLLSPVFPTASHPDRPGLGIETFARWTAASPVPVYALGGITGETAPRLLGSGAVGIAGIGLFA